jgi:LuxR family glucitol operon transcriptional activator
MLIDLSNWLPEESKRRIVDGLIEEVARLAEKAGHESLADTIRKTLRTDAQFLEAFDAGLERAIGRFVEEYSPEDEDLVAAIACDSNFWQAKSVRKAMLEMIQRPRTYLVEEQQVLLDLFTDVLPQRINRERVQRAVVYFLRCLAEELWHLPQIRPVYELQFQRITAERATEMAQELTGLRGELRDAMMALVQISTEQLKLTGGVSTVALPAPRHICHNLPQPTYTIFVGMETELATIRKLLLPSSRHFLVTIDGVGGIGKSALALETAYRYLREYDQLPDEERFDAIIWISAKPSVLTANAIIIRPKVARTLEDLYTTIAVTLHREDITRAYPEEQDDLVRRALIQQRTLLIVDNLETVDDERVNAFLRELPAPTKAIVTTRHRIDVAYPIRLVGMPEDEGLALIAHECEKKGVTLTKEKADKLYQRTGGVPLAIVWSVARMGYGFDVEEVLRQLGEPTGDIARFCFEGAISRIRGTDAHKLIMALVLFETDATRESLGYVAGLGADIISRDEGIVRLERLALINKQWNRFSMLPPTKVFVEHELNKEVSFLSEARKRWVEWAVQLVEQCSPLGSLDARNHDVLRQEYENVLSAIDWCYSNGKWSEVAWLTSHMCLMLFKQGLWHELLQIVDQGTVACEKTGDMEKQAWLYLYATLVHTYKGNLAQAELLLEKTASILERLDEVSDELRESYLYRQSVLARRRDESPSKDLLESQLSLAVKTGDAWRAVSVTALLAERASREGLLEQCDDYLEQALTMAQESGESTLRARAITTLARLTRERGDLDRAKAASEEGLALATMTTTTSITKAYANLEAAHTYRELGDREKTLLYARTALDIFSRLGMQQEAAKSASLLDNLNNGSK